MEADKRLSDNGLPTNTTQFFDLLDPCDGNLIEYAFPSKLYILAAMNQADVSVEPLDVAFLRRWTPITLDPSTSILRRHFDLPDDNPEALEDSLTSRNILETAVKAFEEVNRRIALGRGPDFQIGHGILMIAANVSSQPDDILEKLTLAWRQTKNHIDEVFFGDIRGTAIVLNANKGIRGNPYEIEEGFFDDAPTIQIKGPKSITRKEIFGLLFALAQSDD